MSGKKRPVDYRALKKVLNKFYNFSFKTPRKGKDFSPQQKAAITRKYKKIADSINKRTGEVDENVSFIPYPKKSKLPNVDGLRTSKGIFYKLPNAKVVKRKKRYQVVAKNLERRDVFFPFPKHIINSPDKIKKYVAELNKKYNPTLIRWSVENRRNSVAYDESKFNEIYMTVVEYGRSVEEIEEAIDELISFIESPGFENETLTAQQQAGKRLGYLKGLLNSPNYYNGVFLTFF